jgi:hypothetical protein
MVIICAITRAPIQKDIPAAAGTATRGFHEYLGQDFDKGYYYGHEP